MLHAQHKVVALEGVSKQRVKWDLFCCSLEVFGCNTSLLQ